MVFISIEGLTIIMLYVNRTHSKGVKVTKQGISIVCLSVRYKRNGIAAWHILIHRRIEKNGLCAPISLGERIDGIGWNRQ